MQIPATACGQYIDGSILKRGLSYFKIMKLFLSTI